MRRRRADYHQGQSKALIERPDTLVQSCLACHDGSLLAKRGESIHLVRKLMALTTQRRPAKQLAIAAALTIAVSAAAEDRGVQFLSWYDGWGSHSVWGLGEIAGSYTDAWVKCGEQRIRVKAIYDTHTPVRSPPTKGESKEVAQTHNVALAKDFLKKGVRCEFKKPRN